MTRPRSPRTLVASLFILSGCSGGAMVGASETAVPSSSAAPSIAPMPLPGDTRREDTVVASPLPVGDLTPVVPFPGDHARLTLSQLPPDATFGVWLVPTAIVYRFGLPMPSEPGSAKLGVVTSDHEGKAVFEFTLPQQPRNNGTEVGKLGIWLTYPQPKVVAPQVVYWEAGNPTTFQGHVYDENGQLVTSGARVHLKVTGYGRPPKEVNGRYAPDLLTYFDQEVPVQNGAYRFDRVPAPANTEIEVILPGGLSRKRIDGTGGMQTKWGCCSGNDWLNNYGQPLTYNFGGASTTEDPLAPAYFVSERMADPAIAWTTLSGKVYDQLGHPVPDTAQAIVIVDGTEMPGNKPFHATTPVTNGAYSLRVPTGVVSTDLRISPGTYVLINPRPQRVLLPGKPAVMNFGGPATDEDPDAPQFAFPSPQPVLTGPSPFTPQP